MAPYHVVVPGATYRVPNRRTMRIFRKFIADSLWAATVSKPWILANDEMASNRP